MSLNDKRCKCPFAIKMNGDGCQYCQPQTAIDLLSSVVDDLEEESDQQDARSRRLEAENEALRKHIESIQESRRVEVESNKMFGKQAKDLHKENEALRKSVEELRAVISGLYKNHGHGTYIGASLLMRRV